MHAKSERRRSVPTSIPRCCGRLYVRASRCYDPIRHPPLDPPSALRHPAVPLSKSTERSLTRAARRAQPPLRPHRDLTAVVNAEMEREKRPRGRVFVPPHTIAPRLALRSPRTSPSHASPISPSSLLRRLLHLLLLLHRPTSRYSRIDLLPQRLFSPSPSSSHHRRRRIRGSYRRVLLHSRRAGSLLRDSRQPAAVVLFQQQRVSVTLLLLCSLVLRFIPFDLIPFASSLFKYREEGRRRDYARIVHPPLSRRNDSTGLSRVSVSRLSYSLILDWLSP